MKELRRIFAVPDESQHPNVASANGTGGLSFGHRRSSTVRAAYSSGTPAYGVGAGNSTMIIDETANVEEAARNTMLSKTSDFGSGCSADGNLIIDEKIFDALLPQLINEGGYLANEQEKASLSKAMWDDEGHRLPETVAISPQKLAECAGFQIPADRKFIVVLGDGIGTEYPFSRENSPRFLRL